MSCSDASPNINASKSLYHSGGFITVARAGRAGGTALKREFKVLVEAGLDGLERPTIFRVGVGGISSVRGGRSSSAASGVRGARGRLGPGIGESECRRTAMLVSKALKRSMDSLKWSRCSDMGETRGDGPAMEGEGSTPSIGA